MFQSVLDSKHRQDIKLGLERVKRVLDFLGNPQDKFKSILIGGTNGKGSVTFCLSNLLCSFTEYKVARYTSPHLISWNERFVINEKVISEARLNDISKKYLEKIKEAEKETNASLTEFELYTIIAFLLFYEEDVDIACLEIGMGGRLDATNVVSSKNVLCSVITNVSFDHMDYLGDTLEKIAFEKAGIIKENNIVVSGAVNEPLSVIRNIPAEHNSKLLAVDASKHLLYQDKNIEIALAAWDRVSEQIKINDIKINKKEFLKSISLPGRFQYFEKQKILLDGAHNPDAAIELRKLINARFHNKEIVYILGMLDKAYAAFVKNLIPLGSIVICTEPKSNRATKKEKLANCILQRGSNALLASDLGDGIKIAQTLNHDVIIITGSLYLVGEATQCLVKHF